MGNFILSLVTILSVPLLFFNLFAGIVGFVWLGWLGDWATPLYAFGASLTAPFVLSIPLMLALIFAAPAIFLYEKGLFGRLLSIPFMLLSGLVSWVVMAGWGLVVFFHVMQEVRGEEVLPYLLVIYSVSTSPWSYMASKEGSEANVSVPLFFTNEDLTEKLILFNLAS